MPGPILLPALAAPAQEARLQTVREQRAALERKLKANEAAQQAAHQQLRALEQAIAASQRTLKALAAELAAARAEQAALERTLQRLETQKKARQTQLARLLRAQFEPHEPDALTVLLAGGDPNEAARERHFLARLSHAQAELIAALRADAEETRRLAALVKQRGEKLAELARREEAERTALRARQEERQALLARLGDEIKRQREKIETLKEDERRLAKLIADLARKKSTLVRKPATTTAPERRETVERNRSGPALGSGEFARLRGRLPLPVQGTIAGRYGSRRADGQTVWKGLFIRAPEGAEVRAVAAGTVVFADWLRGYGNLLIVDHEDDFLSVYGHNQTLLASVGQKVQAGKPIATAGASGGLAESGLYFELRHRGQAFDPAPWIAGAH